MSIYISIVVPVFNEATNIPVFVERTVRILKSLEKPYEIIFALDPSSDGSEQIIRQLAEKNRNIKGLFFSRRFGQPAATLAGIEHCNGDCCVIIDVDLQDPPELIPSLVEKFEAGYDVVYARRTSREGETLIKRLVAFVGYFLINKLSDVDIPRNTGDFRLVSRRVVSELGRLNETHGFLRGLVSFVGFPHTFVDYSRDRRLQGVGNYNRYLGSITIGMNGLVSFSRRPLQIMSLFGLLLAFLSFLVGVTYLGLKLADYDLAPGLPTTVILISFFTGIQLLALGLIGEYVGRIYDEVKRRPMYIAQSKLNL